MGNQLSASWGDSGLSSIFRSPFLAPSIILHVLFFFLALRIAHLPSIEPIPEPPISVHLTEIREGTSINKSIGSGQGPGGPRTMPKLGVPIPPAQRTGKVDNGSIETSAPSNNDVEPVPAPPPPAALPGPKVLAMNSRQDSVNAKETSPDSLVRLPTKEAPSQLPGSNAADTDMHQKSLAASKGASEGPGIRALKEGAQIPGALKGVGSGTGPLGVPGGSRSGTGIAGGGTGTGTGGGGSTGLRGIPSTDYNQYLKQVENRVKSVWKYPDSVSGAQKLNVRFTLDRAGKLVEVDVLDSTDARLNSSAMEAMKRASPFPAIPENLIEHLANEPLIIRFAVFIGVRG